jgi:hypothetical protein
MESGGGISIFLGTLNARSTSWISNTAMESGAGIHAEDVGEITLKGCEWTNNNLTEYYEGNGVGM